LITRKESVYIDELVWKADLRLVENMLTQRSRQSIFRYAESAMRALTHGTDGLYFGMECGHGRMAAAWTLTQFCVLKTLCQQNL